LSLLYRAVEERLGQLPGVRSATVSSRGMIADPNSGSPVYVRGYTPAPDEDIYSQWTLAGNSYFETLGLKLLAGRGFNPRDAAGSQRVAVVNEAFPRHYFAGPNPVGKRLGMRRESSGDTIEIVGWV